jgi:heme A synthase
MAVNRSHTALERPRGRRWRHRGREAHRAPSGSQGAHRAPQGTRPITKEQTMKKGDLVELANITGTRGLIGWWTVLWLRHPYLSMHKYHEHVSQLRQVVD